MTGEEGCLFVRNLAVAMVRTPRQGLSTRCGLPRSAAAEVQVIKNRQNGTLDITAHHFDELLRAARKVHLDLRGRS